LLRFTSRGRRGDGSVAPGSSAIFASRKDISYDLGRRGNRDMSQPNPDVSSQEYSVKLRQLGPLIERYASMFSVSAAVHPADHIFRYIIETPPRDPDEVRVKYYFEDGANSARQLAELVHQYCGGLGRIPQVLEFASGYGCVTRHLAKDKTMDLESCDIHPAAIDFIQTRIGVPALGSSRFPEVVTFPHQFDLVFALSFFSHMPVTTWARWLVALTQWLRPGGALVFTTHGIAATAAHGNPELEPLGFWFAASSEQLDLPCEEYGSSIATESFVRKNVNSISSVELVEVRLAYWWRFQDLYVLRKTGG
jgi:SAM-dependent methyltransferase